MEKWSSRLAHNQKILGSNPSAATARESKIIVDILEDEHVLVVTR